MPSKSSASPVALATLLAFALLVAWDAGGADLRLAQLVGTPMGFPLRHDALLTTVFHSDGKTLAWLLAAGLLLAVKWPVGPWRRLRVAERWQLLLSMLAAVGAVTLIKRYSLTSCPWDLQAFGGVAAQVSHWRLGAADGGPGHCFPAGHASAAFGFVGGWFVWRRHVPRLAAAWLAAALAGGLVFGLAQQLRGAHFLSHTLWSAWVCWATGWAVDALMHRTRRHAVPAVAAHAAQRPT